MGVTTISQEITSLIRKTSNKEEVTTIDFYDGRDEFVSYLINQLDLRRNEFIVNAQTHKQLIALSDAFEEKINDILNEIVSGLRDTETHTLYRALANQEEIASTETESLCDIRRAFSKKGYWRESLFSIMHLYYFLNSVDCAYINLCGNDKYEIVITVID